MKLTFAPPASTSCPASSPEGLRRLSPRPSSVWRLAAAGRLRHRLAAAPGPCSTSSRAAGPLIAIGAGSTGCSSCVPAARPIVRLDDAGMAQQMAEYALRRDPASSATCRSRRRPERRQLGPREPRRRDRLGVWASACWAAPSRSASPRLASGAKGWSAHAQAYRGVKTFGVPLAAGLPGRQPGAGQPAAADARNRACSTATRWPPATGGYLVNARARRALGRRRRLAALDSGQLAAPR